MIKRSLAIAREEFSLKNVTPYGGANLFLDFAQHKVKLPKLLQRHPTIKNPASPPILYLMS